MKIKRIYHPYSMWEEYKAGMWRAIAPGPERNEYLIKAIEFTGNAELYGKYMMKVADEWHYSCEHNLSCENMNRQAWIGHAATCLAIGCPEDITREAWHQLTQTQQDEANIKADEAISYWENKHLSRKVGMKCQSVQLEFQFSTQQKKE